MYCKKCGEEIRDDTSFCTNCGLKVTKTSESVTVSKSPPLGMLSLIISLVTTVLIFAFIIIDLIVRDMRTYRAGDAIPREPPLFLMSLDVWLDVIRDSFSLFYIFAIFIGFAALFNKEETKTFAILGIVVSITFAINFYSSLLNVFFGYGWNS